MNELKIFEKTEFGSVRVVMKEDEPWFVASDVAKALGYERPNDAVNTHCKKVNKFSYGDSPQGSRPYNIIPESDVYRLVMRSKLPDAEKFQDWICEDVIPTIRKTGHYGEWNLPRIPQSFPDALRMIADIEEEKQLALEQRDYYRRTKAEIGSRREATAMATASAAVRKVNALEDELGRGKRYRAVKAIDWLLEEFIPSSGMYSVVGRTLKKVSVDLGYSIEKIATPEYPDGINAYHVDVIAAFRSELAKNPGMLWKYRRNAA